MRGLDRERGLGQPVAAERPGRDACWCRPTSASTRLFGHRYRLTASLQLWNSTPPLWLPYAPVSATRAQLPSRSACRPRGAPSRTVIRIGCRVVAAVNCSSRVSSSCTGRPSRSTARATTSSVSISCLPPKPPPTRAANTRTWLRSRPKQRHELVPGQERGLGAGPQHQPPAVQPADGGVRLQVHVLHPLRCRNVSLVRPRSAAAKPAPRRRCRRAPRPRRCRRRRPAAPGRRRRLRVQHRRARRPWPSPGRTRRAGPRSPPDQRAGRRRPCPRLSATTAATRWPANRTVRSSTSVSYGSSPGLWCRAVE